MDNVNIKTFAQISGYGDPLLDSRDNQTYKVRIQSQIFSLPVHSDFGREDYLTNVTHTSNKHFVLNNLFKRFCSIIIFRVILPENIKI
jgi:hypothetical protein